MQRAVVYRVGGVGVLAALLLGGALLVLPAEDHALATDDREWQREGCFQRVADGPSFSQQPEALSWGTVTAEPGRVTSPAFNLWVMERIRAT